MFSITQAFILLLLGFLDLSLASNVSTYSQGFCFTALTNKQLSSVRTTTEAATLSFQRFTQTTTTPTVIVTPASTTLTILATSTSTTTTTQTQLTDTSTSTYVETDTSTQSTTEIITATNTITSVVTLQATTTIEPSSGFTPLASAVGFSGSTANKRRSEGQFRPRRAISNVLASPLGAGLQSRPAGKSGATLSIDLDGNFSISPAQYPTSVVCYELVEVITLSIDTYTAARMVTSTAPQPTLTQTITTTQTATSTIMPIDASTTITTSMTTIAVVTTTIFSTTTIASTTTATSTLPIATYYAACAPNNIISTVNGNQVVRITDTYNLDVLAADSAYDCCVACLGSDTCGTSLFVATTGGCYSLTTNGQCDPSASVASFQTYDISQDSTSVYLSNSNCGQITYKGPQ